MAQGFTISPPLLFETELSPLREVVDGMQLNSKTRGGVRNLLRVVGCWLERSRRGR